MPHIHTKPGQHDHTASAYIIRIDGDEPQIILHKHKKSGMYQQFGGHIELDETPWQAVLHEVREESGYGVEQLTLLQPKERVKNLGDADQHPVPVCHNTHKFNDEHFHTDIGYAFVVSGPPKYAIGEGESPDIIEVTANQLMKMTTDKTYENIKKISLFVFETCLPKWEKIPAKDWPV